MSHHPSAHPAQPLIEGYFARVATTLEGLDPNAVAAVVDLIIDTQRRGGTIFTCGNGGSASTASHMAGDFVFGVSAMTGRPFKAQCLSDNQVGLLAVANDLAYSDVFVDPLQKFLTPNDLVIGVSGSGNSPNVVKALEYAKYVGAKTIALCGFTGGKIKTIADYSLHANIQDMEISEDIHLILHHCIKQAVIARIQAENRG